MRLRLGDILRPQWRGHTVAAITASVTVAAATVIALNPATATGETPAERCARETAAYNAAWESTWRAGNPGNPGPPPPPPVPYVCHDPGEPTTTAPTTPPTAPGLQPTQAPGNGVQGQAGNAPGQPPRGNSTDIVPVPGAPENASPVPALPPLLTPDRVPVREIPGTPQPAPVTPQPPPGPKEVWSTPKMPNGYWYRYEKTTLLDTYGYTPQGESPLATCGGDSTMDTCTIGQGKTASSSITTQTEIGASLGWSGGGVSFGGNTSHSTSNIARQDVTITVGCSGPMPPAGSVVAGYAQYHRQQFVIYRYLMPPNTLVDQTYGEGLFPQSSLMCKTVPADNLGWK